MSPGPVMCTPPPLPGELIVVLPLRVTFVRLKVVPSPDTSSIPPPARTEVLPEIVAPSIVRLPPTSLRIPPPLPAAPVAVLPVIMVLPLIITVPPALKTPPPPWSDIAPAAVLFSIVTSVMVITPVPFHKPPPSALAVLLLTTPPVIFMLPGPVMCTPPPLPGELIVVLPSRVTLVKVKVVPAPELSSIPPPARTAVLPEIVAF